jgi:peptidoglycan/xylan/chitin deacetylase (PgdA/CDA1 family)
MVFALISCDKLKGFDGKPAGSAAPSASAEGSKPPFLSPNVPTEQPPDATGSPTPTQEAEGSPPPTPTSTPAQTSDQARLAEQDDSSGEDKSQTSDTKESGVKKTMMTRLTYDQKTVYLTFDDGPSRAATPQILKTLSKYGVRATFFPIARDGLDDIYKQIIAEGHSLGNHSFSHNFKYLYQLDNIDDFRRDVIKMHDFMHARFQYEPQLFRYPGGTMGRPDDLMAMRREVISDLGYRYFDWNVSSYDDPNGKNLNSAEGIIRDVLSAVGNAHPAIILFHDAEINAATAAALDKLIPELKKQGYVFDTLDNFK